MNTDEKPTQDNASKEFMTYKELTANSKVWEQLEKSPRPSPYTGEPMTLDQHEIDDDDCDIWLCWCNHGDDFFDQNGEKLDRDPLNEGVTIEEIESAAIKAGLDESAVRLACGVERGRLEGLQKEYAKWSKISSEEATEEWQQRWAGADQEERCEMLIERETTRRWALATGGFFSGSGGKIRREVRADVMALGALPETPPKDLAALFEKPAIKNKRQQNRIRRR